MKYGLLKRFVKLKAFFKQKIDRKVIIFLFFFLIASFFWLLNALSKEYTTDIGFPVRYSNFPRDKVMVGDLTGKINIKIKAYGFTLLRYKLKPSLPPIPIDLRSIIFNPLSIENNVPNYYILTRYEIDKVDRQLSNEIEVEGISPDTLYFQFVNVVSKVVPVKVDINLNLEKQYQQNGNIIISPDSLILTGPKTILDTTDVALTENRSFNEVNDSIKEEVDIISIKNVKFSATNVDIIVPIEKFTEANLSIPIQIVNLPDTLSMTIFPKELKLTFLVALSQYDKVKDYLFKAEIDFNKIDESLSQKLKIDIVKRPDFVRELKHYPLNVDYILEK